jgi:hypothetical protein
VKKFTLVHYGGKSEGGDESVNMKDEVEKKEDYRIHFT